MQPCRSFGAFGALGMVGLVACGASSSSAPSAARTSPPVAKEAEAKVVADAAAPLVTDTPAPAPPPPPPPIPAAPTDKILIIGDSHAFGPFGKKLHENFARAPGVEHVVFEAGCGATSETFLVKYPEVVCGYRVLETKRGETEAKAVVNLWHAAKTKSLDDMLKRYTPNVVVVVLGTNYPRASVGDSTESFMKRVCREDACPRVFWVGPPAFGVEASAYISKTIRGVLEHWKGATFIDSTTLNESKPLPLRKPHFGDEEAKRWADYAFAKIAPELWPR